MNEDIKFAVLFEISKLQEENDKLKKENKKLKNRYLKLIINGNAFKIKSDVKELQYIDYENNGFTLEVLEKWD